MCFRQSIAKDQRISRSLSDSIEPCKTVDYQWGVWREGWQQRGKSKQFEAVGGVVSIDRESMQPRTRLCNLMLRYNKYMPYIPCAITYPEPLVTVTVYSR